MDLLRDISVILALILINGMFAMIEFSVISSRKTKLEQKALAGSKKAKIALGFAEKPTALLSAIQVGISLVGIIAGAFGGVVLAEYMTAFLQKIFPNLAYISEISFTIVVILITYFSLVIGELVPKRVALGNPEKIAMFFAFPMRFFLKMVSPLVFVLTESTHFITRLLGIKKERNQEVTDEEIELLIEKGAKIGNFEKIEQEMVQRIFHLSDLRINSLMIPRAQLFWLDLEDDLKLNLKKILSTNYLRFPVAKGDLDELVGVIHMKDVLRASLEKESFSLEELVQKPILVPESMKVFSLMELFKKGTKGAVVVDEYGGIVGFISPSDILREITGYIPDYETHSRPAVYKVDDGLWIMDATLNKDDFKKIFDLKELPEEEESNYITIGGFILNYLGHIPVKGETLLWENFSFQIEEMEQGKIEKIRVTLLPEEEAGEDEEEINEETPGQ